MPHRSGKSPYIDLYPQSLFKYPGAPIYRGAARINIIHQNHTATVDARTLSQGKTVNKIVPPLPKIKRVLGDGLVIFYQKVLIWQPDKPSQRPGVQTCLIVATTYHPGAMQGY